MKVALFAKKKFSPRKQRKLHFIAPVAVPVEKPSTSTEKIPANIVQELEEQIRVLTKKFVKAKLKAQTAEEKKFDKL